MISMSKHNSGSVDKSIAITVCTEAQKPQNEVLQRLLDSVKCTAWVSISKVGIVGPF